MAIDFDLFLDWAKKRFGEHNIKTRSTAHGTEICTHSIWSESKLGKSDNKFHLWMNPSGGKSSKNPDIGSYRCWLTDEMGSLVGLVSQIEDIDWEEAEILISGGSSLRQLEQQVHDFFGHKETLTQDSDRLIQKDVLLPPHCYVIEQMHSANPMKYKAEMYMSKRKLSTKGLYVCVAGEYDNRILIPYYDSDDHLIYYNARIMSDKKNTLRYMKPSTVDQKEVLYMTEWPNKNSQVFITEGEFDAMTLKLAGFVGCACGGKFMSDSQIELIRSYEPVLAFDSDSAGLEAMLNIGNLLLERGFSKIYYVRPPKIYKDWNGLLVNKNIDIVRDYVEKYKKSFTKDTQAILLSHKL